MGIVQALNYIPKTIQKLAWGCVKAPGFDDRKSVHISIILTDLRSSNRGSFHAAPGQLLNRFRYIQKWSIRDELFCVTESVYPSNLTNWFLAAPSSSLYGHRFKRCPFDRLHRPCASTWPASTIKKLKRWDCQIPNFSGHLGIISSFFTSLFFHQ